MGLGLRLTVGLWVTMFTLLSSNIGVTSSSALLRILWQRLLLLLSAHRLLLLLSCPHLHLLLALAGALLSCGRTAA